MFSLNITTLDSYYYRFIDITSLFLIYSLFLLTECQTKQTFNRYDYNENTQ